MIQIKNIFFFFGIVLFLIGMIKYSYLYADMELHWDAKNYYDVYLAIYSGGEYNNTYLYFGEPTEFLFPIIYKILSIFPEIDTAEGLILLHTTIFSTLYITLLIIMINKKHINLSGVILLLGLCPPGVATQLARQAIAFPIIICIILFMYKKTYSFIAIMLTTAFTHFWSIFGSLYYLLYFRQTIKSYYFLFPLLGYTIVYIFIEKFGTPSYLYPIRNYFNFGNTLYSTPSLSQWVCLVYLISALIMQIILVGKIRLSDVHFSVLLLIPILLSSFTITRVVFGFYFFLIPLAIIYRFRHLMGINHINYTLGFSLLFLKLFI